LLILISGCATSSYLDLSTVMNNPDSYVEQTITVKGTAEPDLMVKCTTQMCEESNPCCRTCSSRLLLTQSSSSVTIEGGECKGNNCEMTCFPLEQGKEYLVSGFLKKENSKYIFFVQSYEDWK
ncbi:MAG: hypothetical protein KKF95_02165, partial [Nanoarchaeota archaeon]|nr:hypothetical protein [Nanoarchaeota archaeon]